MSLASFWSHAPRALDAVVAVVDVVVVAYLVYRVLLLIRGTRAQQILLGLTFVGLGYVAARALGLQTLSWILDRFIGSLLLIVVVVFQHDIRRGLSRMGRTAGSVGIGYGQGAYLVEELVRAAEAMAKSKTGAILVIEREADLTELAETGVRLDARVTSPLLVQLFTSPGPLHDGAVVIQQGRVSAAAVFLPLSQATSLDPTVGTRHRAAIGLTEELDAVALVVSEERGEIRVADRGALSESLDPSAAKRTLQTLLASERTRRLFAGRSPEARSSPAENRS